MWAVTDRAAMSRKEDDNQPLQKLNEKVDKGLGRRHHGVHLGHAKYATATVVPLPLQACLDSGELWELT